jgi:hypothetical protein
MKRLVLVATLTLSCLTAHAQTPKVRAAGGDDLRDRAKKFKNGKRFFVKYDKFKDQTMVFVGPFSLTGSMEYAFTSSTISIYAAFVFKGQKTDQPVDTLTLGFVHTGKEWQFLKSSDVYVLADGERMVLGEGSRDSDLKIGSVEETVEVTLSADMFSKIANSKVVEMKVGSREFKLKDEHLQALHDLLSLTKPASGGSSP